MPQAGDVVTLIDLDGRPTGHFRVVSTNRNKLSLRVITATAFGEAAAEHQKEQARELMKHTNAPTIQE